MTDGLSCETITQDDEDRDHEAYDVEKYLAPLEEQASSVEEPRTRKLGRGQRWEVRYSRMRTIALLNRGNDEVTRTMDEEEFTKWVETLQQSLKLGLQLELFTRPGEIESFVATHEEQGVQKKILVLYDTMPGGTGYLKRLYEHLPRIAEQVRNHLEAQDCETACYACLKDYWNQRIHALSDRKLVDEVLAELAAD